MKYVDSLHVGILDTVSPEQLHLLLVHDLHVDDEGVDAGGVEPDTSLLVLTHSRQLHHSLHCSGHGSAPHCHDSDHTVSGTDTGHSAGTLTQHCSNNICSITSTFKQS